MPTPGEVRSIRCVLMRPTVVLVSHTQKWNGVTWEPPLPADKTEVTVADQVIRERQNASVELLEEMAKSVGVAGTEEYNAALAEVLKVLTAPPSSDDHHLRHADFEVKFNVAKRIVTSRAETYRKISGLKASWKAAAGQ